MLEKQLETLAEKSINLLFGHDSIMFTCVIFMGFMLSPLFLFFISWKYLYPEDYDRRYNPEYKAPQKKVIGIQVQSDKITYDDTMINVT